MASTALPSAARADEAPALRPRTVAAYAATAGPTVMLGLPFSVYLPPYIAEGGVISVALVGLLFSLTTIWDGAVDPLIGTMIDRVRTGLGAHRRWMLLAIVPLALLLLALVTVGDRLPFAALFLMMVLFYSSYSIYEVAQLSWGSALVRTPADSALLYGMRDWFAKVALILAFAAPAAAQLLIPGLSLQGRIMAYASLFLLMAPIALFAIRRVPLRAVVAEPGIGWRHEIRASLSFPPLMLLLAVQFLNSFAFGSLTSLFVFFAAAVLDLDAQSAVLLFASFIGGAFASPVWTFLARRFGKPPMMIAMGLLISSLLVATLFQQPQGLAQAVGFSLMLGTGFVGLLFTYSMLADLIPRDAARCGRNRSAFLFALLNLMQKFGVAAAIAVSYLLLDLVGFDPQNGKAAARELHLLFALQPTLSWIVMAGLLLWMQRALSRPGVRTR
ncbi:MULTISPECIES: MFS transporter [unclassified Sphingopyxis]|uniref:MFS transporter n=1 Tax=unclassified Sphingopyxis TaxID=2614943 RepID=UPI00285BD51D|nr:MULTISPECIES: MFS transporter [unclassified Sphingopyxis]MDR7059461.1 Na+/melibiose symporter-like transporter [Sphingopyxis sp. BE235]MDR7181027.1 Na+/melibiose symporter-like transporter [Sphingopyxis sp. BE249]